MDGADTQYERRCIGWASDTNTTYQQQHVEQVEEAQSATFKAQLFSTVVMLVTFITWAAV